MARPRGIIVRGKQRKDVDPMLLLGVLLEIGEHAGVAVNAASPDAFAAAIEDRAAIYPPQGTVRHAS